MHLGYQAKGGMCVLNSKVDCKVLKGKTLNNSCGLRVALSKVDNSCVRVLVASINNLFVEYLLVVLASQLRRASKSFVAI